MIKFDWWPDDDDITIPLLESDRVGHGPPRAGHRGRIAWRIGENSDLDRLQLGDALSFRGVHLHTAQRRDFVQLPDWSCVGGIVLALIFDGLNSRVIYGGAVMVGPGVALCASHVVEDYRSHFETRAVEIVAMGTTPHGRTAWQVMRLRFVPKTDLCILSLTFVDGLPADLVFNHACVTTRVPRVGERLTVVAFMPNKDEVDTWEPGLTIQTRLIASSGSVLDVHLEGRALLPGAVLHLDCETHGGISGGPVFDSEGWLVGLVSRSINVGDKCTAVSLALSSLAFNFYGGWPDPGSDTPRSLLAMASTGACTIERPESIKATYPDNGRMISYEYTSWRAR